MHVLRHSAAMRLLRAGIDTSVIALWLGHEQIETTQIYLHADLEIKERALAPQQIPTQIATLANGYIRESRLTMSVLALRRCWPIFVCGT